MEKCLTMNSITSNSIGATPVVGATAASTTNLRVPRDVANLHTEIFDFLCTYHRVKRLQSKDTNPGELTHDMGLSDEQRGELINRALYKILNEIELRIGAFPVHLERTAIPPEYHDEWAFLAWTLIAIVNRLRLDAHKSRTFLDYGGKHFQEKINTALVELVNKAQKMEPPIGVGGNESHYIRFYQSYVTAIISLHDLYTLLRRKWLYSELETQIALIDKELSICFQFQREFCINHGYLIWQQMRESQIRKMTQYGVENRGFTESAMSFYSNMLYNLGVLAARLQGLYFDIQSCKMLTDKPNVVEPLLSIVYTMVDVLLGDSILCLEPSQNAILVTNNLFPMKILSLCRCALFKDFSIQIVSEEVAQQVQQQMRQLKTFEPPVPIRPTPSAALLAMKPSTGVKRNNATASAEGGNTAHKKSDVNSKEWISIPPSFDSDHQGWRTLGVIGEHPHLLCTTRQKDTLLDTRSAGQTGKRPLFYFHVKAEIFNFMGTFSTAHTLSLPFTIATRRNQDCQVQRMMSSYTATCFWLYGTNVLNGQMIQWYDNEIEWKHFKILYAQYFSLNSQVIRSLTDDDFTILQHKMHCLECTEHSNEEDFAQESARITFKNVLCPHLHYSTSKTDLKFSVWRGMLELLHLFSDQRTSVKSLWESGLLQGFMETDKVHSLLLNVESGLVMRLSFVIGGCVCFTVKSGAQILNLEPLNIRRLQAKSLHEYIRDILIAEKVELVLNSNHDWIHVNDAIKLCKKSSSGHETGYNASTKEVVSNVMYPGRVDVEQNIRFTAMRVAVVTCKPTTTTPTTTTTFNSMKDDENTSQFLRGRSFRHTTIMPSSTFHAHDVATTDVEFDERLDALMRQYGKTTDALIETLRRRGSAAAPPPSKLLHRRSSPPPPPESSSSSSSASGAQSSPSTLIIPPHRRLSAVATQQRNPDVQMPTTSQMQQQQQHNASLQLPMPTSAPMIFHPHQHSSPSVVLQQQQQQQQHHSVYSTTSMMLRSSLDSLVNNVVAVATNDDPIWMPSSSSSGIATADPNSSYQMSTQEKMINNIHGSSTTTEFQMT